MRTILVLESDDGIQGLLDAVLRHDGYGAVVVPDGKSAVAALRRRDFGAFIIDLSLAPSTLERGARRGTGFLHYLQRHQPRLLRRVIVVTGLALRELPVDFPPVCCVLRKPFDLAQLRSAIESCAS